MADGDFFIGSREELLYARGDRIENPALGIVPALLDLAPRLPGALEGATVYFLEVYGKGIGGSWKQYTGEGNVGYRLFDVAYVPPSVLSMPREQVSSWRQHGGQQFGTEEGLTRLAFRCGVDLVPRLGVIDGGEVPRSITGMRALLRLHAASSARLDDSAKGGSEGIVLRTEDRGLIAKARIADYDRTLLKRAAARG
jgi:hypothetical protein